MIQDVGIAIVLKAGQEGKLSADSLRDFMKDKVAKFKLPKKVSSEVVAQSRRVVLTSFARSSSLILCQKRQRARSRGGKWRLRCLRKRARQSCRLVSWADIPLHCNK